VCVSYICERGIYVLGEVYVYSIIEVYVQIGSCITRKKEKMALSSSPATKYLYKKDPVLLEALETVMRYSWRCEAQLARVMCHVDCSVSFPLPSFYLPDM
jgi:hypothetical protein